MKNVIKITALGLVALLGLSACDKYNEFVNKYDPDGTLRCMFLDEARAKAAEQGVALDDWLKTENLVVCATVK
jgi:hypothetical protein